MSQPIKVLPFLAIIMFALQAPLKSQDTTYITNSALHFPDKFLSEVNSKSTQIEEKLDRQTRKYLSRLAKEEAILQSKLSKIDSITCHNLFSDAATTYERLEQGLNKKMSDFGGGGLYSAWFDTLKTSLKFLDKRKDLFTKTSNNSQIKEALEKVKGVEGKFHQAERIKDYIKQRRQLLKDQLSKYGFAKDLKRFNKQAYYFSQQVNEYKQLYEDPSKIEAKAISLLNKVPAFQDFMKKYGLLAGLFDIPENYGESVAGLQTRAQVQNLLQQRIQSIAPNGRQLVQQNIESAQSQLHQLRNNLTIPGNSDGEMPDFKPNIQKAKRFNNRLEFGLNLQTTRSTYYFPTTTDIGLSIGYKLNDSRVLGVGAAYKLGLGKDIKNIAISHEGIGFRTFLDWKVKGTIWITGSAELNYRSQFKNLQIFKNYSDWQRSALIGLSKKYFISPKVKGNIQVMYDLLHSSQPLAAYPLHFRVGYNL